MEKSLSRQNYKLTTIKMLRLDLEISNPCNERRVHCYRVCKDTKLAAGQKYGSGAIIEWEK